MKQNKTKNCFERTKTSVIQQQKRKKNVSGEKGMPKR